MHSETSKNSELKILRMNDVIAKTGFSRAWIYELIKQGDFPSGRKIGSRAVGFSSIEVDAWINERLQGLTKP
ncbi:MAG: AlpA family transcriptional regulator [Pseudomonas sp.]|nr:AlpA family transcriptional regulator [Pseudomonas sp.]